MPLQGAKIAAVTRTAPGLLVVECDAEQLKRDGVTRSIDVLIEVLQPLKERGSLRVHRLTLRSAQDLVVARAFSGLASFDAVILVGHGAPWGLTVAPMTTASWFDVGRDLAAVRPRTLLSISCFGASSPAVQALLQTIPTLNAIVGSPAPLTVKQAQAAALEVLAATFGWELPRDASAMLALLNAATTGGVVFRRTRDGVARSSASDLAFEDSLADIATLLLQIAGIGQQARGVSRAARRRFRNELSLVTRSGRAERGWTRSGEPRLQ